VGKMCAGDTGRKAIGIRSSMNRQDGYDTVEWAAALPYANGKWECLADRTWAQRNSLRRSPSRRTLRAFAPMLRRRIIMTLDLPGRRLRASGFNESWPRTGGEHHAAARGSDRTTIAGTKSCRLSAYPILGHPPRRAWLRILRIGWRIRLRRIWKQWSIEDHYAQIQCPVFNQGAWYDIFLGGTLRTTCG